MRSALIRKLLVLLLLTLGHGVDTAFATDSYNIACTQHSKDVEHYRLALQKIVGKPVQIVKVAAVELLPKIGSETFHGICGRTEWFERHEAAKMFTRVPVALGYLSYFAWKKADNPIANMREARVTSYLEESVFMQHLLQEPHYGTLVTYPMGSSLSTILTSGDADVLIASAIGDDNPGELYNDPRFSILERVASVPVYSYYHRDYPELRRALIKVARNSHRPSLFPIAGRDEFPQKHGETLLFGCIGSPGSTGYENTVSALRQALAQLGYKVKLLLLSSEDENRALLSGRLDGSCAHSQRYLDKTDLLHQVPVHASISNLQLWAIQPKAKVYSLEEIPAGSTVGVSGAGYTRFEKALSKYGVKVHWSKDFGQSLLMLASGRIDYYLAVEIDNRGLLRAEDTLQPTLYSAGVIANVEVFPSIATKHLALKEPLAKALRRILEQRGTYMLSQPPLNPDQH